MERIRISQLKPGRKFDLPLFSVSGHKLLPPGVVLSDRHILAIQRGGDLEVIAASSLTELQEAGIVQGADATRIHVGAKASETLVSSTGSVVVEQGESIEQHHVDALDAGETVFTPKRRDHNRRQERILLADSLLEELLETTAKLSRRVTIAKDPGWGPMRDASQWPEPVSLTEIRMSLVEDLAELHAQVEAGLEVSAEAFEGIVDAVFPMLDGFPNRFTQLALLCPRKENYLPDHAFTVMVLAMATGRQLNWPLQAVREVGFASLIYDLGMLLIPERIRTGGCELTDMDRTRVQRHPVLGLSMIQTIKTVPPMIQLAALQHHERENATGYPRQNRGDQICDLARVLAVADTTAAITEPRHYRHAKLPYNAIEETLRSASAMQFWKPAVRAMLQSTGLFPVGSCVKLSNGNLAHVIASNPEQLDRPIIQVMIQEGDPLSGRMVDLATVNKGVLSVVRPVAAPQGSTTT